MNARAAGGSTPYTAEMELVAIGLVVGVVLIDVIRRRPSRRPAPARRRSFHVDLSGRD